MLINILSMMFVNMAVITIAAVFFAVRFARKRQRNFALTAAVVAMIGGTQLVYVTTHLVISAQCHMNAPWSVVPPIPMRTEGCEKYWPQAGHQSRGPTKD